MRPGQGGARARAQGAETTTELCAALRPVVQGASLALRQRDCGSGHCPGHLWTGGLWAAVNLSDPQCPHLCNETMVLSPWAHCEN